MTKRELINFEAEVAGYFKDGCIHAPVHLAGGNETQLIKIFKKIKKDDYVFSTWRSHYHYLLHTEDGVGLMEKIINGRSMHIFDRQRNFFSSAIVAGCVSMAVGVAWALKQKKSKQRVHIFLGDGAFDQGFTFEAVRYAGGQELPIIFYYEDNNRSVATTKKQRWGKDKLAKIVHYNYRSKYPHCGTGAWVNL
jgi:TPP-dependent pyruvate/acetoin dehydrogenase alpha subunit